MKKIILILLFLAALGAGIFFWAGNLTGRTNSKWNAAREARDAGGGADSPQALPAR